MTTGPRLFADFRGKAKDVLTRDYLPDQNSDTLFDYGKVIRLPKFCYIPDTGSSRTFVALKLRNITSSKFEVQYIRPNATYTIAKALNHIGISTTIGNPTFALGAKAHYSKTSNEFTKYDVGISFTEPKSCASIILGDKGDTVKVSYICHPGKSKKNAVAGEMTRRLSTNEISYTVGGTYAFDKLTAVKARINNHGKLGAVFQRKVNPKTFVTVSTEFDTKALEKTPRFDVFIRVKA